jgi:peptidoglycan-N-acetylglucosamine deacetylase
MRVADQIRRNADFLPTYGVDGTPYFRPPYGRHTPTTHQIVADPATP